MKNSISSIPIQQAYYSAYNAKYNSYYHSNDEFFNDNEVLKLKKLFKKIENSNNTIDKNDIIYTGQLSDIPRFKLKEFINEYSLKRTSKIEFCNCIIISRKVIQECLNQFQYKHIYFVNKNVANEIIESFKKEKVPSKNINLDKYFYVEDIKNLSPKHQNNITYESGFIVSMYRNNKLNHFYTILNTLLNNPNIKIIFDEDLFTSLNKDCIELTDEYESVLREMLFSKDKSNLKLAIEMIANLTMNSLTILKLAFLLNEFHQSNPKGEITQYSQTNRNLKTLLNIFKSKSIFWSNEDWKTFASGMKKNCTTKEEDEIVKKFIINNLNNEFNSTIEGLKIEDIKFVKLK